MLHVLWVDGIISSFPAGRGAERKPLQMCGGEREGPDQQLSTGPQWGRPLPVLSPDLSRAGRWLQQEEGLGGGSHSFCHLRAVRLDRLPVPSLPSFPVFWRDPQAVTSVGRTRPHRPRTGSARTNDKLRRRI